MVSCETYGRLPRNRMGQDRRARQHPRARVHAHQAHQNHSCQRSCSQGSRLSIQLMPELRIDLLWPCRKLGKALHPWDVSEIPRIFPSDFHIFPSCCSELTFSDIGSDCIPMQRCVQVHDWIGDASRWWILYGLEIPAKPLADVVFLHLLSLYGNNFRAIY